MKGQLSLLVKIISEILIKEVALLRTLLRVLQQRIALVSGNDSCDDREKFLFLLH